MKIGFVGLGHMGKPMALNLVRAGHDVIVFNRSHGAAEDLAKEGASIARIPAEAADAKVVVTMLSDDSAVEALALGHDGVAERLAQGCVHVSMSTISPALSKRLAVAHSERRQLYVSAPVFGRPEAAAAAKLFIVAAGSSEGLAIAKPLFDVLGQRTFEVSSLPEHANLVKVSGNFLIMCVLESLGEVFTVSRKAGLQPEVVFDVLSGTLFDAPIYRSYGWKVLNEEFSPAGFKLPLGLKDIRLMLECAETHSAPMPFASIIKDRFLSSIANGYGDLDWSAMTLAISQSAGLLKKPQVA